jgi:undecaprenyl-diphosphatase
MHQLDLYVFHLVNEWSGNWALDRIVKFEEDTNLLRGGLPLILCWWFWFSPDREHWGQRRQIIVGTLLGTLVALVLARGMAMTLPFRVRPMHEAGLGYHSPSLQITGNREDWSAFPSDTAALFFALSFGILRLSRLLGAALMVFSAVWICLPRIYLGFHYPSDILAGALLGIATTWATITTMEARGGTLGRRIMRPLSAFEKQQPGTFYAAAFTLTFSIATMFDDLRAVGRASIHWLRHAGFAGFGGLAVVFLGGGVLLALAALVVYIRREATASKRKDRGF